MHDIYYNILLINLALRLHIFFNLKEGAGMHRNVEHLVLINK